MKNTNTNNTNINLVCNWGWIATIVLIIAKVWGGAEISWFFCFIPAITLIVFSLVLTIIGVLAVLRINNF